MNTEWRDSTKTIVAIGLAIFGIYLLYISRSILGVVLLAFLLALLVRPMMRFFNKRLRFPRLLAVLVTYLIAVLIVMLAPLVLVPPVINAVNFFLTLDYAALINGILDWLEQTLIALKSTQISILNWELVLDSAIDPLLFSLNQVSPSIQPELPSYNIVIDSIAQAFALSYGIAISLISSVLSGFLAFLLMLLASIYISLDSDKFHSWFIEVIPEAYRDEISCLLARLQAVWDSFFRGELLLMIIVGVLVWAGLSIMGIPGAFALGFMAGLLEVVPTLGPILSAIPAMIVVLIGGSNFFDINHFILALIVIGFYSLVNGLENSILVPRLMGHAVRLHPLMVLFGIVVGASVAGLLGALLATPVIATGKEVIGYLYRKLLGKEPFPEPALAVSEVRTLQWFSLRSVINGIQRLIPRRKQAEEDTQPIQGNSSQPEAEGSPNQERDLT